MRTHKSVTSDSTKFSETTKISDVRFHPRSDRHTDTRVPLVGVAVGTGSPAYIAPPFTRSHSHTPSKVSLTNERVRVPHTSAESRRPRLTGEMFPRGVITPASPAAPSRDEARALAEGAAREAKARADAQARAAQSARERAKAAVKLARTRQAFMGW